MIFGASRGLGAELAAVAAAGGRPVFGWARKEDPLRRMSERLPSFEYRAGDLAKPEGQEQAVKFLLSGEPVERVFVVAGGGPYGAFHERPWAAHEWCWALTFQFPARVVHALLAGTRPLPQVILIGSAIAENAADPRAASYAAAKHALRGLYASIRAEAPDWDLRLFSPGYIDTEMLPKNAAVRQKGVYSAALLAQELWEWSLSPADIGGHRVYPRHPV